MFFRALISRDLDESIYHGEGNGRVCSDAVFAQFLVRFGEIFLLSCGIAVLQNQSVWGI